MSIWNRVFAGLVALSAVVFFYMAAKTIKIRQYWFHAVAAHQQAIKVAKDENAALIAGTAGEKPSPSLQWLRLENAELANRGRVWHNCTGRVTNPQTGVMSVAIGQPLPHGIADKSELFVFSEADREKGGQYLGEFNAAGVSDKIVGLAPVRRLSENELRRLAEHKGPLVIYERMPLDDRGLFAGLKLDDLKALIPEQSLAEYARDGQAAAANDPPERKEKQGSKEEFVRRLRDYRVGLTSLLNERAVGEHRVATLDLDFKRISVAVEDAKREEQAYRAEIESLKKEAAEAQHQQQATLAHRQAVESKVKELQGLIDQQIAANRAMADQLARLHTEVSRRIDQRSSSMAAAAGIQ